MAFEQVLLVLGVTIVMCLAALVAVVFVSGRESANVRTILAQADVASRAERANSDKLLSKLMAIVDPNVYALYRQHSMAGIPEGSIAPVQMPAPPGVNGGEEAERAMEDALRKARARLEHLEREPPAEMFGAGMPMEYDDFEEGPQR